MATTFGDRIARMRDYLIKRGINPDVETSERVKATEEFLVEERAKENLEASLDPSKAFIAREERNRELRRIGMPEVGKAVDELTGYQSMTDLAKPRTDLPIQPMTKEQLDAAEASAAGADKWLKTSGEQALSPFDKALYWPGMGAIGIEKGRTQVPLDSLHPMEAYEAGLREMPNGFEVSLWEKRHRGERMEKAVMGGVAKGLGNIVRGVGHALDLGSQIAGVADKVTGLNTKKTYGALSDAVIQVSDNVAQVGENTQRFMWGKGLSEGSGAEVGGKVLSGVSEIVAMGPMFRALGKYALPIYEGIMGFGESNPDTEVYVPGVGNVRGRFLPTIIGTAHGAALKSILHWAEGTHGLAGRVKGAAAFGLPDLIGQIASKQGIDPEEVAASLAMGGLLTHGVPTGKVWRGKVMAKTGDLFKAGPGDLTLEKLNAMNKAGTATTAMMGLGGKDLSWLSKKAEDKVPLGDLEPGRGRGRSSEDITRERVDALEGVIDVLDSRIPAGGPVGPKGPGVTKNEMFQRLDEDGNPLPKSFYSFMGTGGKELDWLKNKRQDVAFVKANAGTVHSIDMVEKKLVELNGGPFALKGSMFRKNADLYGIAGDVDQMCPRSQGQRNTQAMVELATGIKLTPDHVADLREFMRGLGEAVACPQCYTESHRIMGAMATKERPMGDYKPGSLQKRFSTPSGKAMKSWLDIHTGIRYNANTDYKPQHLPQLMKSFVDAAQLGMHSNSYTKRFEFVDIFAPTRMRINISLGSDIRNGRLVENLDIGVPWEPTMARRSKYDNVGTVNIVKSIDEFWLSMEDPRIDHIIGLHHSGIPVRIRDRWGALDDFTGVQSDHWLPGISIEGKARAKREYEAYCKELGVKPLFIGKKGDEHPAIGDWMHRGDIETFFSLCDRFGLKPRLTGDKKTPDFSEGGTNPNYMKAVGPECGKFGDNTREPVKADFNWGAVRDSINNFAQYGGMDLDSWYSTTGAEYLINKLKPGMGWKAPEADVKKWGSNVPDIGGKPVVGDTPDITGTRPQGEANYDAMRQYKEAAAKSELERALEEVGEDYGGAPAVEGQAVKVDRYRQPLTYEEYRSAREEASRRISGGETVDDVAKDMRARGYNVTKKAWGLSWDMTPSAAMRKAAGEPVGLPENPGKYPMGNNLSSKTTKGNNKSPYLRERYRTIWDIMRGLSEGTETSYNLLKDTGMPGPEMSHAKDASPWERAAFFADSKGNLMTNIREVLQTIVDGPVPLWQVDAMEHSGGRHTATAEELKGYAKFLLGLEHVDGPVRWGADKRPGVGGVYEPDTGLIVLNPTNRLALTNAVHEAAHGAGMRFRSRLSPEKWDALKVIYDRTKDIADGMMYGDTDVFEHGAETLANSAFRERNERAGKREALDTTMVAMGDPGGRARGMSGQDLRDYINRDVSIGERSIKASEAVATESREGLTTDMAAHPGALRIQRNERLSDRQAGRHVFKIELPGGQVLTDDYTMRSNGRTDAEVESSVRSEINERWIKGTYLMGLGGKDVEAIKRALVGAPGVTKQDEQKAVEFFKKMEAKEPSRAPAAPGVPLKSDRTILPYGTTERAALEKSGIVYKGEVGKPQELLDQYDKHAATMNAIKEREPMLSEEMDKPLPDRPSNFAEIFPGPEVVKNMVAVAKENPKGLQGWFETGLRYVERAGGGPMNVLKDVFYTPMKRGLDEVEKSVKKELFRMKGIAQYLGLKTSYKASVELGKWLAVRQYGGEKSLELSGVSAAEAEGMKVGTPPDKVQKMMNWMDRQLLQAFHEVNRDRIRSGQEPIEWRKDYFTFWHMADAMNKQGVSLFSTPKDVLNEAIATWEKNYENDLNTRQAEFRAKSRFSKWMYQKRSGELGPIDLDAYGVFGRYMKSAYEQMYLSQAQSVMKKLVDGSWEIDGKEWRLSDANKTMRDSLSNYMGFLATGAKPGEIPKHIFEVMNKLGRNVAVGKVGGNFKSSLNQITSNVHSWSTLGSKYWAKGFADYAKAQADGIAHGWVEGGKWNEAKEVGDLGARRREAAFEEFMNKRPRTSWGRGGQKVGALGMSGLQALDMITAEITWRGAYAKAMAGEAEGMMGGRNHERAVDYANAEVARTQGSTQKPDITPFQRGQFGKVLSVLQNFTINEWGFVTRDVMGIKNADKGNPEHVKRAVRFMVGAMVVHWFYEDVLGIRSPFNVLGNPMQTVGAAVKEYRESGNVLKAAGAGVVGAAKTVPIIGRGFEEYGAGGGLGAGLETVQKGAPLIRKPSVAGAVDWAGSLMGVPGSFAASRAIKIREKGGTVPEALIGAYPEEEKKVSRPVYDPETGTWKKPAPKSDKKKPKKVYDPATGEWK